MCISSSFCFRITWRRSSERKVNETQRASHFYKYVQIICEFEVMIMELFFFFKIELLCDCMYVEREYVYGFLFNMFVNLISC